MISSVECFKGEIDLVNRLFDAGMSVFHLRKPGISLKLHSELLQGICPQYHNRIVLHQFREAVNAPEIRRFHYSEAERKGLSIMGDGLNNEIKGVSVEAVLSTSIHALVTIEEISDFDYAFFGPVFDSVSKPGYAGMSGDDFKLPAHLQPKLVAIGGITKDNIEAVFDMGFDKTAVLGVLWNKPDQALDVFKQLQKKCE